MSEIETTIVNTIHESAANCAQLRQTVENLYQAYPDYPVLKTFFFHITHLNLNEVEAHNLFQSIIRHCAQVAENLDQPFNFYVGMLDYIIERNRIIMNPVFVDLYLSPHSPQDQYKDPLTLTFNQNYFTRILNAEIGRSRRRKQIFSLLMLDIDKFSQINNNYGFNIGNQILVEVVARIQRTIRAEDSLIRYYDDRFILIMPSTNIQGAENLAERILSSLLKDVITLEKRIYNITFSMGIVEFPAHGEDQETLLENLRKARYRSKEAGGNSIAVARETDV